jgi:hypothetical protein
MLSEYKAIGFPDPLENPEFYQNLFTTEYKHATEYRVAGGSYLAWALPGGPELWATIDRERELLHLRPHFVGDTAWKASMTCRTGASAEDALDGGFYCWKDPHPDNPADSDYPFVIDCAGFRSYDPGPLPALAELSVSAFALEFKMFPTREALTDTQPVLAHVPEGVPGMDPLPIKMGASYFFPRGTMVDEEEDGRPYVDLAGQVLAAEVLVNRLTDVPFHRLRVATAGKAIEIDVLVEIGVADRIEVGSTIEGIFWMSGRPLKVWSSDGSGGGARG